MGAGAGKVYITKVNIDPDPHCEDLTADAECLKVIKSQTSFDIAANTVVSASSVQLDEQVKLEITCKNSGVLRIGLTALDPSKNENVCKGSVFEKEDGFDQNQAIRILYRTDFNLCYGPDGSEREYEPCRDDIKLWLYIIYVYGNPEIDVHIIDEDVRASLKIIPLVNGSCLRSNTATCKLRQQVVSENVYHCRWDMMLQNEILVGKQPTHGYMSVALISLQGSKEVEIWKRSSAVQVYPFSSIIAFCVDVHENTVAHNLAINSVGQIRKDVIKVKKSSGAMYFVIEFSSGQIEVVRGSMELPIKQDPGSLVLVSNYKFESEVDDLHEILIEVGSKLSFRPRRIQFGDTYIQFVLEFNQRLSDIDVRNVQRQLCCHAEKVTESDKVQVMVEDFAGLNEEVMTYEIEQFFSRERAGGGSIKRIKKDKDIPGYWLIQFASREIARNVYLLGTPSITIGDTQVKICVLPYIEGLGKAVRMGNKPRIDRTPLTVDVDRNKLRFVMNTEDDMHALSAFLNREIKVQLIWPSDADCESDFESDASTDMEDGKHHSVTLLCIEPDTEFKTLFIWKYKTKKLVLNYFNNCIHEEIINIKNLDKDVMHDDLERLQDSHTFVYEEEGTKDVLKLYGSNKKNLNEIAEIIGNPVPIQIDVALTVPIPVEKYMALEADGVLSEVKNECSATSFKLDVAKGKVSLKGPKNEVEDGHRRLLTLAIDVKRIHIELPTEHIEYLNRGGNSLLKELFEKKNINTNFSISESSLDVDIYVENVDNASKVKDKIQRTIKSIIMSLSIPVVENAAETLQSEEWDLFKKDVESKANGPVYITEAHDAKEVLIYGTSDVIKFAKVKIQNHLNDTDCTHTLKVPLDVAEYIDEFMYADGNIECERNNSTFTGKVKIKGTMKESYQSKQKIEKLLKSLDRHWFLLDKQCIAGVVQNLVDLKIFANDKKVLLQLQTGDTLARCGYTGVALSKISGTAIKIQQGLTMLETTAAIVHKTDGSLASFAQGFGKHLVNIGGDEIKMELLQKIQNQRKTIQEQRSAGIIDKEHDCIDINVFKCGDVIVTNSGRLPCVKILHAFAPVGTDESLSEEVKNVITKVLKTCQEEGITSIAFPPIGCDRKSPKLKTALSMVHTISDFIGNKNNGVIKEVVICDVMIEVVNTLTAALNTLKSPWMVFNHGLEIDSQVNPYLHGAKTVYGGTVSATSPVPRPQSGLKWGRMRPDAKQKPPNNEGTNGSTESYYRKRYAQRRRHSRIDDIVIGKIMTVEKGKDIQKQLENIFSKQYITKTLNFQELTKESQLTDSEEKDLKAMEEKYGIEVEIQSVTKCVMLTGLKQKVDVCEVETVKLLKDVFPQRRARTRDLETVASTVQWFYDDGVSSSREVDPYSNYEIHSRYLRGKDFQYYNTAEDRNYKVNIKTLMEHPIGDTSKKRQLHLRTRIDKKIHTPHNWTAGGKEIAEVKLSENEPEFNEVKQLFIKCGCNPTKIESIYRIENKYLWLQYQTKKSQLDKQNPKTKNERRLWHGTKEDTAPKIVKNGFDRSFHSVTYYGKGAYFATDSSYSHKYSPADTQGVRRMFLNRVLVGVYCAGDSNMATLPLRPGVTVEGFNVYYDSAVNNVDKPGIFVIFHDTQAYPEYLIMYK